MDPENNPHNVVHVYVGGLVLSADGQSVLQEGYMSDPDFAALDPIFYLHHSNIDRIWADVYPIEDILAEINGRTLTVAPDCKLDA